VGTGQDTRKGSTAARIRWLEELSGGQLNFASSHKQTSLQHGRSSFYFSTRSTAFAHSAGIEGDPIGLALKRTKNVRRQGPQGYHRQHADQS